MAIEVQTTQNVTIDYEPAGVGYRFLGYLLDWIIIILWVVSWGSLLYLMLKDTTSDIWDSETFWTLFAIIVIMPVVFYDLIFETLNHGQSPGKMICRIKVVNLDGTAPSLGGYLLRWMFRIIDFTPFVFISQGLVAFIMVLATKNSQRLGDCVAGTTVIDLKSSARSKVLTIADLDFRDDYSVSYPDVLDRLSDRDIQTIISILRDPKMNENDFFIQRLADRVRVITNYTYDVPDRMFLNKIISDYNYLAIQ